MNSSIENGICGSEKNHLCAPSGNHLLSRICSRKMATLTGAGLGHETRRDFATGPGKTSPQGRASLGHETGPRLHTIVTEKRFKNFDCKSKMFRDLPNSVFRIFVLEYNLISITTYN
ncbi:unnamed protein product, partial [Nesidiocoris tenuis]